LGKIEKLTMHLYFLLKGELETNDITRQHYNQSLDSYGAPTCWRCLFHIWSHRNAS